MKLSPPLRRFREQLQHFPEEIALGLAPMLQRLSALVGELAIHFWEGTDPEGFDGVSQRGEYQRLLATEWLLSEAEPDEFLRRAAMKEHLFLKLARRKPKACRRSLALFDAGPSQLGSPRLAHLAMLLVLERRARAAKAEFAWGVLQAGPSSRAAAEKADVEHLLRSRSASPPTEDHVSAWITHFAPRPNEDEIWWIGGNKLLELIVAELGPRMRVSDPLHPNNDRLNVSVEHKARRQHVELQLPNPVIRTQLLRNPFESPPSLRLNEKGSAPFWFSNDGKRLFMRQDKQVLAYAASANPIGRPKALTLGDDERLRAIGWYRKRFAALIQRRGMLIARFSGTEYRVLVRHGSFALPFGDTPLCPLYVIGKTTPRILLLDANGTLFVGRERDREIEIHPVIDRIPLLVFCRSHFEYVRLDANHRLEFGRITLELQLLPRPSTAIHRSTELFSAFDSRTQRSAIAVRVTPSADQTTKVDGTTVWEVVEWHRTSTYIQLASTERAVGLVAAHPPGNTPENSDSSEPFWSLLVQSNFGGPLLSVNPQRRHTVVDFNEPLRRLVVSDAAPRIAYELESGAVHLRNLWTASAESGIIRAATRNQLPPTRGAP